MAIGIVLFTGGSSVRPPRPVPRRGAAREGRPGDRRRPPGRVGGRDLADQQRPRRRRARHQRRQHHAASTRTRSRTIGQLSLTGVANRFVGLSLSGGGPADPKRRGAAADPDARDRRPRHVLLDSLTPQVRVGLQQILRTGAYLRPPADRVAVQRGVRLPQPGAQPDAAVRRARWWPTGSRSIGSSRRRAQVAGALAARNGDLGGAVTSTAPRRCARSRAERARSRRRDRARRRRCCAQGTGVLNDVNYSLEDPRIRSSSTCSRWRRGSRGC